MYPMVPRIKMHAVCYSGEYCRQSHHSPWCLCLGLCEHRPKEYGVKIKISHPPKVFTKMELSGLEVALSESEEE